MRFFKIYADKSGLEDRLIPSFRIIWFTSMYLFIKSAFLNYATIRDLSAVSFFWKLYYYFFPVVNITAIMAKEVNMFDLTKFFNMTVGTLIKTFHNPNVQQILNNPKITFDLVIAEWMFTELNAA